MLTNHRSVELSTTQPVQEGPVPERLAGGDDPDRFDWAEAWHPVYYLEDLDKDRPNKVTLLEQDLVIWWERSTASWRVFVDQCPHRLAPLSEGRLTAEGLLECPYHGWAFTGEGACDRIPQQPNGSSAHTSQRACVQSLPVSECQGLLFVYPGNPDNAPTVTVPRITPMEDDPDGWVCLNTVRNLPYDALTLLENVLDPSHVPFTHHKSVGNRSTASPVELELVQSNRQGFEGFWQAGPRKGTLGSQSTQFIAPNLMWHDLTSQQFGRTMTVVYVSPIRKGECRLFARFPFRFASQIPAFFIRLTPRWYSHLGQNNILEDDQIFLHYQERYLEAQGGSPEFAKAFYLPTRADTFVTALRRWVNHYQADPFHGKALPPVLPTPTLLDRYQSHTQHCASCRQALATIQRLRLGLAILGLASLGILPLLTTVWGLSVGSILVALIPLLAGASWFGLGNLERQFYHGRAIPPRNRPERHR